MGVRSHLASNVAPLFLRLALGITFVWAGGAKLFSEMEYKGEQAAALANMGVSIVPTKGGAAQPPANPGTPPAVNPGEKPTMQPPATPIPPGSGSGSAFSGALASMAQPDSQPPKTETPAANQPGAPTQPTATPPAAPTPPAPQFTAADFPEPVKLRMVYMLALGIEHASHVPADAHNKIELWPPAMAGGSKPVYFAFAAALTEFLGGIMVLLGFFTRLGALGLAWVMLVAIWMTQVGPAIQADKTMWLIIPRPADGDWWNMRQYQDLLWQFTLCMGAMALFFTGPGRASLDAALWTVGGDGERPRRAAPAE